MPQLFHIMEGASLVAERQQHSGEMLVILEEPLLAVAARDTADFLGQEGIGQDAPSQHPVLDVGIALLQTLEVFHSIEVATIDEAMVRKMVKLVESVPIGSPLIHLLTQTRVDNDEVKGIGLHPLKDTQALFGRMEPEPHLDGETEGRLGGDGSHHLLHAVGVGHQAAAAVPAHHLRHGAPDIPIEILIAVSLVQQAHRVHKMGGHIAHQLRHGRLERIMLGPDVAPVGHIEFRALLHRHKGRHKTVYATKMAA